MISPGLILASDRSGCLSWSFIPFSSFLWVAVLTLHFMDNIQFSSLLRTKLIGFGADDAGARAGAKPCSSPDTWTEACGTNQEMAQAQALYKSAPQDAWGSTGGMPVCKRSCPRELVAHALESKCVLCDRVSLRVVCKGAAEHHVLCAFR